MCWSATCYYVRTVAQRTISQARTTALRLSKLSRWRIDWTLINAQQDIHKTVVAMLATGLSCTATDLVDGQVHITVRSPDAHENPAHRLFPSHPGKIGIASMGTGGIVCVDEPHRKWAETELTALRIVATVTMQFTKTPAVRPPTMVAAIAEQDGKVAGVCGASADSPYMWQLRSDVRPCTRDVASRQP